MAWAQACVRLNGEPISFKNRPYLNQIYEDDSKSLYIAKGRQLECSTYALIRLLHFLWFNPHSKAVYVTNRHGSVREFSKRLSSVLQYSPVLHTLADPRDQLVTELNCKNGSVLYLVSGHDSYVQARSIDSSLVILDESQNSQLEDIGNLREGMSHSKYGRLIVIGTGSPESSEWHKLHSKGTGYKWDGKKWNKTRDSKIPSYTISMDMADWITPEQMQEKRESYPGPVFDMECMGAFPRGTSVPFPESLIRESFRTPDIFRPDDINRDAGPVLCGVDWGQGGQSLTVAVLGQITPEGLKILHYSKWNDADVQGLGQKVADYINHWTPDRTISDIGGNAGSLQIVQEKTSNLKVCALGEHPDRIISYDHWHDKDQVITDKTYFMQQLQAKFQSHTISIPYSSEDSWIIDDLNANTQITATMQSGKSVMRFVKTGSPNDFTMALTFCVMAGFVETDEGCPGNFVPYSAIV